MDKCYYCGQDTEHQKAVHDDDGNQLLVPMCEQCIEALNDGLLDWNQDI